MGAFDAFIKAKFDHCSMAQHKSGDFDHNYIALQNRTKLQQIIFRYTLCATDAFNGKLLQPQNMLFFTHFNYKSLSGLKIGLLNLGSTSGSLVASSPGWRICREWESTFLYCVFLKKQINYFLEIPRKWSYRNSKRWAAAHPRAGSRSAEHDGHQDERRPCKPSKNSTQKYLL